MGPTSKDIYIVVDVPPSLAGLEFENPNAGPGRNGVWSPHPAMLRRASADPCATQDAHILWTEALSLASLVSPIESAFGDPSPTHGHTFGFVNVHL